MDDLKVEGHWRFIYGDGTVIERKNLITQSGLNLLASLLINEQQNDIPFYLAMGSGTNLAVASDTQLQTETFRKIVSSKTRQASTARLRTFLLQSEANGDHKEFGIYLMGTEERGSGTLLNRLVAPISKTSNTVLTVEVRIVFNAG